MGDRIERRRRGDHPGDQGRARRVAERARHAERLAGRPAVVAARRRVVAEVRPRGRFDPVGPVSVVDRVEVFGEDLVLRPLAGQVVGEGGLPQLLEDRPLALGGERVLHELLGYRRRSLLGSLLEQVGYEGAGDAPQVDAGVRVEALVLDRDDRPFHLPGDLVLGDENTIRVVCQEAELLAVDRKQRRVGRPAILDVGLLERGEVRGDRHHHPEEGRDDREQPERDEDDQQAELLDPRPVAASPAASS